MACYAKLAVTAAQEVSVAREPLDIFSCPLVLVRLQIYEDNACPAIGGF